MGPCWTHVDSNPETNSKVCTVTQLALTGSVESTSDLIFSNLSSAAPYSCFPHRAWEICLPVQFLYSLHWFIYFPTSRWALPLSRLICFKTSENLSNSQRERGELGFTYNTSHRWWFITFTWCFLGKFDILCCTFYLHTHRSHAGILSHSVSHMERPYSGLKVNSSLHTNLGKERVNLMLLTPSCTHTYTRLLCQTLSGCVTLFSACEVLP